MSTASTAATRQIGEFILVGVLGEGGSGIVYDARWGHREVALKVLHPALVATAKEREQFLAEAKRLAEIHHAGVVKVLAVGEAPDGRPFLAMEKLAGEPLAARIARGPLPVAQALDLFGQLCDAVDALHERGLVHRDLKPENVMLVGGADGRDHAVLLDFGIAKELGAAASTTTQDGGVRGTPAYMAPERFFGQAASVATDVYELAVTLFAMLAGRLPWDDCANPEARLDPRRLAEVAPSVPAALDVEVRRALSTRAQNRPASAAELRAAVMQAAGVAWAPRATVDVKSQPVPVNPYGPTTVGRKPARSRKGPVIGAFVAVAVIATGIGVTAHYLTTPGEKLPETTIAEDPGSGTGAHSAGTGTETAPVTGSSLTMADAVARLPDDELFALGVHLRTIEEDATLRPLLDLIVESTPFRMFQAEANLGTCDLDLRRTTDWVVVGGPAEDAAVDLIAAGRWTRAELEACLAASTGATSTERAEHLTRFRGGRVDRTIAWLDDHAFVLSSREQADDAWLAARRGDTTPPAGALGAILADIDLADPMWIAGDDAGFERTRLDDKSEFSGLWGSLSASPSEIGLDLRLRYDDAAEAAAAEKELQGQVGGLGLDASMGHIRIGRDPRRAEVIHVDMAFSRMIAAILVEAAAEGGLTTLSP